MKPISLSHYTATSCIGTGLSAMRAALAGGRGGLTPCAFETVDLDTWIGEVPDVDAVALPADLRHFDCRNNRLAWLGLQQDGFFDAIRLAAQTHGEQRVGVFLGTSTSGILDTELAYRERDAHNGKLPLSYNYRGSHNVFSVAEFVRTAAGLHGPAFVVSSACSSSAKVFAAAARMLQLGLIDAAVVGGVDSLCLTTLYGFNSLELTAPEACRPFDVARKGISIGEAAAFALLSRAPLAGGGPVRLLGYGESSDAHHMSSPHPEGRGARQAMAGALERAGLSADQIDYINLHGTGTPSNDAAEGKAVEALFGDRVAASSTKGATGHTLGAAGGLEAVICALALTDGLVPANVGLDTPDPGIHIRLQHQVEHRSVHHVLSNSFGFGGTNASLVFGQEVA
ncbi:beta-ketoacyl-[acyl-carrier-protein] synthase family protein [Nitrogeniibacter aestuarii]|uniref:beta-ketoacyl-[acyl-carrier-protein] synthase family protein n=1 Tax=Nitrogeniibacter aestuarii TaxID=2815343 RepID=UPI001E48650B|nr:beta-ketoacyl-[acyl-carrier-protein] synthase family protein [Nitrogeniibacter aestuarii]